MIQIYFFLITGFVLIQFYNSYIPHKEQLAQSTNFSLNRTFNWDDLDLNQTKKAMCGFHKCFFLDKLDPNIGYLFDTEKKDRNATGNLILQNKAFDQAQRLKVEYKIRHFLDGPSFIDKVPTSRMGDRMNSMINIVGVGKTLKKNRRPRYFENTNVIVQRNRVGPIPHALIGCQKRRKEHSIQNIEKLINNSIKPSDRMRFYEHFHDELNSTAKLLQKEPLLVNDFQVMIDTNGRVYHLDFERMLDHEESEKSNSKRLDECLNYLKTLSEHVDMLRFTFRKKDIERT